MPRWTMAVRSAPRPAHLHTRADRDAAGRALRSSVAREDHASFSPAPHRRDPVDILLEDSKGRVERLVPIRYGRMVASPFAFFRGTAGIMAADLADDAVDGLSGAVLRRLPPDELRGIRDAGTAGHLRHQRLRRDVPGAMGVGPQAAGDQLRHRQPRERPQPRGREGGSPKRRPALRRRASGAGRQDRARCLVFVPRLQRAHRAHRGCGPQEASEAGAAPGDGAHRHQGVRQARPFRRRPAAHPGSAAAGVPPERGRGGRVQRRHRPELRAVSGVTPPGPTGTLRPLRADRRRDEGRGRGQRGPGLRHRPVLRLGGRRAVPPGEAGRDRRCSSRLRGRAGMPRMANGSCTASA